MKRKLLLSLLPTMLSTVSMGAQTVTISPKTGADIVQLSSLDLSKFTILSGERVRANLSTAGRSITLRDTIYASGVGTHAPSKAVIKINGATRFTAVLGIDDEAESATAKPNHGIADYEIRLHKNKTGVVVKSGTIDRRDASTVKIDIDLRGYDYLTLDIKQGSQAWADHVDWADARFTYNGEKPVAINVGEMYIATTVTPPISNTSTDIALLGDMDLTKITNGWGKIKKNKSIDGNSLTLNDTVYTSGVGTHATAKIIVKLNGATRFVSRAGIDDEVISGAKANPSQYGIADYRVSLKGENGAVKVMQEGTLRAGTPSTLIDVDCNGWKYLILEAPAGVGGNSFDHVDFANAYFEYVARASTPPYIVSEEEIAAKLACATTVFSQPGVRFMHKLLPATDDATLTVEGLPAGLTYNTKRRLVEGIVEQEGVYTYNVKVESNGETTTEPITLTVSSSLQQPVPFMGWLSWNVFEADISDAKVRAVADAFERYKLADYGYRYLVIDDQWHAKKRNTDNTPMYNITKFPNGFKPLADYVHAKGLKFGIYSDAGSHTCAGEFGSYGKEEIDAKQYAEWGFDLLKYDYCNAPDSREEAQKRYTAMGNALKNSGRDILFYMCEWGQRDPWKWGAETGATCWRVTYDSRDKWDWGAKANGSHVGVIQGLDVTKQLWPYGGVNRWNDADMMCVGLHGKGKSSSYDGANGMTQTEYRSQFSLWSIMASPLTLSFDVRTISPADLAIITNSEVIAVNQDRMGQQGELIFSNQDFDVFAKDLENGDIAVAVLNRSKTTRTYTINLADIYLNVGTSYAVRDLWKKQYVDTVSTSYTATLASHETGVYRFSKVETSTGITHTLTPSQLKVKTEGKTLKVHLSNSEGKTKRILISDPSGRIVAQQTTRTADTQLPTKALHGVYMVNVICGGKSQTVKITL